MTCWFIFNNLGQNGFGMGKLISMKPIIPQAELDKFFKDCRTLDERFSKMITACVNTPPHPLKKKPKPQRATPFTEEDFEAVLRKVTRKIPANPRRHHYDFFTVRFLDTK